MFRTECGHRQDILLRKSKLHLRIKLHVVRLRFQSLVMTLYMLLCQCKFIIRLNMWHFNEISKLCEDCRSAICFFVVLVRFLRALLRCLPWRIFFVCVCVCVICVTILGISVGNYG